MGIFSGSKKQPEQPSSKSSDRERISRLLEKERALPNRTSLTQRRAIKSTLGLFRKN